ncbi:hypothetical protein GCK72_015868 [Caenorhabditis remanei]|uniref:Homeobox domain-containing protein n=1 Tax=Caenorhabditis remanei TaxID=31234 RepID=A0A6A5GXK7_CAERE|nr:hypothetical protein GCK72_015868 [Caenorhabditis remanei]KAF1759401.1 hypothetical protein GCK72_015868 [Caenorhabditis remanei]
MEITLHQHEQLAKFYKQNRAPNVLQETAMGESVGLNICEVHSWFCKCRDMGPEALWAEISLRMKKSEEQRKKKEREEEMKKAMTKLSLAEAKITSQAAEIQKLESWITNLTTMANIQQSIPARLLNVEKELKRVSSKLEEAELKKENERLKEQKKELEAMLQSKKKLEEQVENGKKENEELNKIIARQASELRQFKHLKNAEIQNLIKNSVKDQVNAQQDQAANLTTMAKIQQSLPARLLNVENVLVRVCTKLEEAELKKDNEAMLQLAHLKKENKSLKNAKKEAERRIKELLRENEILNYDLFRTEGKVADLQTVILKSKEEDDAKIQKVEELMAVLEKDVEKLKMVQEQDLATDDEESEDEEEELEEEKSARRFIDMRLPCNLINSLQLREI